MGVLSEHPTVKWFRERVEAATDRATSTSLNADWLRRLCLEAGADDVGFVEIDRPELDDQRDDILRFFPQTKTLISFVCRMNREPIRSPARSVANLEFHHTGDHVNETARRIVAALEQQGIRAVNPAMGFPMEMDRFPGRNLGRLAQAGRRRGGPRSHGHPPQRHPPQVRQLHPAGHGADRCRGDAQTSRSTTTRAWSASSAWRPVRSAPSARTVTSTSRPATRTTTGSSWAASPTGSSRSPTAKRPGLPPSRERLRVGVDVAEPLLRRRTTRRPTAWPSARRARM